MESIQNKEIEKIVKSGILDVAMEKTNEYFKLMSYYKCTLIGL